MRPIYLVLLFSLTSTSLAQTVTEQTIHSFSGDSDGAVPTCCNFNSLIQASDGNFYGEAYSDGDYGFGTIFKTSSAGNFSLLYSFEGINDGAYPQAELLQGNNGALYGTAYLGGYNDRGTFFAINNFSSFSSLYAFRAGSDGGEPNTSLTQGSDGNFYGATAQGGGGDQGTIYKMSPNGDITILIALSNEGGPASSLLQGTDSDFYALTYKEIYKFDSTGAIKSLASLSTCGVGGGLIEGVDGGYYGSYCAQSGAQFYNAFFKLSASGALSIVYSSTPTAAPNSSGYGLSTLILGSDGNFYGVTSDGGADGFGSLFRLTTAGTFTTLYSFTNKIDGENPIGPIIQGSDGSFYGLAQGGINGDGVIYKISLSPALPAPVALSFNVSSVNAYTPVTLSWVVPNGTSKTFQQCAASVQGNPSGAGTWTGLQAGAFSDGVYFGSSSITPTAAGTYTYALTCGGVESGFATLVVNPADRVATRTGLTISPNPATAGQIVTLSSAVTKMSGTGTPTGAVTFYYGSVALDTVTLNASGVAAYSIATTGFPAGNYTLTATYNGDATDSPSNSTASTVTIKSPAQTSAKLTASPAVVAQYSTTMLSAAVSSSGGMPTGQVTFYYGGQSLGVATLSGNGVASLSLQANVPKAGYSITASYGGDGNHAATSSQPVLVTVQ